MAKKSDKSVTDELTVSSAAAAALFDVKTGTLRMWKTRGADGSVGHNQWYLPDLVEWFQNNILESRLDSSDPELATSKRAYWAAKARREQLRADTEAKNLFDGHEILEVYATLLARFKSGLLSFKARLAPRVLGKDYGEVMDAIWDECCLLLSGFSGSDNYVPFEQVPKEYQELFGPNWHETHKKGKKNEQKI